MHKGTVRRVHQPDDGVIDAGAKTDAFKEVGRTPIEAREARGLGRRGRVLAEEHPNVALYFLYRVAAGVDAVGGKGLAWHKRGYLGAASVRVEPPAVIAALDLMPVKPAGAQRHATMRAQIAQRESRARRVAPDQNRRAEHELAQHTPAPQASARDRVVPSFAQWCRSFVDCGHTPGWHRRS